MGIEQGIQDRDVRRAVQTLERQNQELRRRLDHIQRNAEGPMSGVLPRGAKKATDQDGSKDIASIDEIHLHIGGEGDPELLADIVKYLSGATVESLEPLEAGAETTTGKSMTVLVDRDAANIAYAGGSSVEAKEPAEAGAEQTTGKSLTVLVDRDAANIAYAGGSTVEAKEPAEAGAEQTTGKDLNVLANRTADKISYAGGSTVEAKEPAEAGAEQTTGKSWSVMNDRNAANLNEDASRAFVHPSYTDGSRRPDRLRRAAADVLADDISKKNEVASHIGGENDGKVESDVVRLSGSADLDSWQRSGAPNNFEGSKIHSNTVDTNQLNADAATRIKIASRAISGDKFVEGVVDEYQTMGSTLSDAQWDAITA